MFILKTIFIFIIFFTQLFARDLASKNFFYIISDYKFRNYFFSENTSFIVQSLTFGLGKLNHVELNFDEILFLKNKYDSGMKKYRERIFSRDFF